MSSVTKTITNNKRHPKVSLSLVEDMRFEPACDARASLIFTIHPNPPLIRRALEVVSSVTETITNNKRHPRVPLSLVEDMRFELTTSCMPCKRSNQLS